MSVEEIYIHPQHWPSPSIDYSLTIITSQSRRISILDPPPTTTTIKLYAAINLDSVKGTSSSISPPPPFLHFLHFTKLMINL